MPVKGKHEEDLVESDEAMRYIRELEYKGGARKGLRTCRPDSQARAQGGWMKDVDHDYARGGITTLTRAIEELNWRRNAWARVAEFPLLDCPSVDIRHGQDLMAGLLSRPAVRMIGDSDYWSQLISVGTSFTEFVFMPVAKDNDDVRRAMIGWLTFFWYLDTVVDEYRDELPNEDALNRIRMSVESAWLNGDSGLMEILPPTSAIDGIAPLARLFFDRHADLLRSQGFPATALEPYWASVTEHIRFQLSPSWLYRRFGNLDEYLYCRTRQSGMECILKLVIILSMGECPAAAEPLIELANISMSLLNDLFSYPRDLAYKTTNAVTFLKQTDDVIDELCVTLNRANADVFSCALALKSEMDLQTWSRVIVAVAHVFKSVTRWHFAEPRYADGANLVIDYLGFQGQIPYSWSQSASSAKERPSAAI
jgi:Terpene synthase family 2, C-terminal metal binding